MTSECCENHWEEMHSGDLCRAQQRIAELESDVEKAQECKSAYMAPCRHRAADAGACSICYFLWSERRVAELEIENSDLRATLQTRKRVKRLKEALLQCREYLKNTDFEMLVTEFIDPALKNKTK